MNYLAHAYLSPDDPQILMGNLWGDLLRPKDYDSLNPSLIKGVIQHKIIDTFTDQHEDVDQIVKLLRPYQAKYTPVVADVLMDFILGKFWHMFHEQSLEDFCKVKYKIVAQHLHLIPDRLHPRIHRMMENRWLESCASRDRMKITLRMLSKRASFENNIPEAMMSYDLHEPTLDRLFLSFFDDLRGHVTLQNGG
jgi:acyl carrier protein phosphodiesterase